MWVTLFATGFVLAISIAPAGAAFGIVNQIWDLFVTPTSGGPGFTVTPSMTVQDACRGAVKITGVTDGLADAMGKPIQFLADARKHRQTPSIFARIWNPSGLTPPTLPMNDMFENPKQWGCLFQRIKVGLLSNIPLRATALRNLFLHPVSAPAPTFHELVAAGFSQSTLVDAINEFYDTMPSYARNLRKVFGLPQIKKAGEAINPLFNFFQPAMTLATFDPILANKLDAMLQPCNFCVPYTVEPVLVEILRHYRPQLVQYVESNPMLKGDAAIYNAVLKELGSQNRPLAARIAMIPAMMQRSKAQAENDIFALVSTLKSTLPVWKPKATTNTGINMGTMMNMMAGLMQQTAAGTTGTGTMPSQSAASSNVQTVQPAATPIDPWAQAKTVAETIFGTPANPAVPASSAPSAPATGMGSTQQGTVVPAAAPAAPVASATVAAATTNKMATSQGTAAVASAGVTSTASTAEEMEANKIVASILSNTDSGPVSVLPDLTNPKTRNLVLAGLEAKLAKITQAIAHISASPTMIQTASAGTAGGTGGTAAGTLSTNTATTMASQTTMAPIASANNGGTNSAPAMMNLADMIGMFMPQAGASASVAPTANMSPATNPSPVVAAPPNPTTVAPGGTADQGTAANTGGGMTAASQTNPPQTAVIPGAGTSGTAVNTATQSAPSPSVDVFDAFLSAMLSPGINGPSSTATGSSNPTADAALSALFSAFAKANTQGATG